MHFPIARCSLATAANVASLWWGKPAWALVVGTLTAPAAMATGFIELSKVDANHPATRDLNQHMLLVMTAGRNPPKRTTP